MQRPSVCNAAENLLVDREIAEEFLPIIKRVLEGTELRGCEACPMAATCNINKNGKKEVTES